MNSSASQFAPHEGPYSPRSRDAGGMPAVRPPTVFRLTEARRSAALRHLLALDTDDRYLRFGHAASDAVLTRYAAGIDFSRDVVLAVGDASGGFLIGLAHVALQAPCAEFGLSVLPQWRSRGIGRWLFVESMRAAMSAGMRSVACITGNSSVLNMARDEGFSVCIARGEPRAILRVDGG